MPATLELPSTGTFLRSTSDTDPTMAIFRKMADPNAWGLLVKKVPVFIENTRRFTVKDADGNPQVIEVKVDEDRLRDMVEIMRRTLEDDGVPICVFSGHRKDPKAAKTQDEQPDSIGWCWDFEVGPWGPKQKIGILATVGIDHGQEDKAKKLPFRSLEFYPKEMTGEPEDRITGLALLKNDPYLNMGVLTYGMAAGCCFYSAESTMPDAMNTNVDPTMTPGVTDQPPSPDESAQFMRCMNYHFPHMAEYHAGPMAKYSAEGGAGAFPGANNVAGPPTTDGQTPPVKNELNEGGKKEEEEEGKDKTPVLNQTPAVPLHLIKDESIRLAFEQQNIRAARYEADLAALRSENQRLASTQEADKRTALLSKYEYEMKSLLLHGVQFELSEVYPELKEELRTMPVSQWDATWARTKKHLMRYQKDPTAPINPANYETEAGMLRVVGDHFVETSTFGDAEPQFTKDDVLSPAFAAYQAAHPGEFATQMNGYLAEKKGKLSKKTSVA